jgi:hypothetical protein
MPPVLRARDFRLYTQGGGRLVDLWQEGGRAVLGHTPPALLRELKNSASRGLFASFPHPQEGRFLKALSQLLPGRSFRFYTDQASLYRALETAGFPCPGPYPQPFPDPAFPAPASPATLPEASTNTGVSLWRPFLAGQPSAAVLIPVLPWPPAPQVIAFDPGLENRFALSDILSPVLLAAVTRGVYDLIAVGPQGGRPVYPKINHALFGREGQRQCLWRHQGIYLTYMDDNNSWENLFRRFLEGGFLIPPSPRDPLILPGALSPGEESKLAALLVI